MPRYFFHVWDGRDLPDTEGSDFPNDTAARDEAMEAGAQIIAGLGPRLWASGDWQMRVVDDTGHAVATLSFSGNLQLGSDRPE